MNTTGSKGENPKLFVASGLGNQPADTNDALSQMGPTASALRAHLQSGKRQEAREVVDTSAVLHLIDLVADIDGRILDISLGGCRIHTATPFHLGIFRRVEIDFRLAGMSFRLAGVTQAIYDKRTIGIRFLDMSERKREQLLQLMDEIRRDQAPEMPIVSDVLGAIPAPRADA